MSLTYHELFRGAVSEAHRKGIQVWDEAPPANRSGVIDGLRLHYLDWDSADRPPMLLLHGAMVTAHVWDFFSLEMREHFHIHAVDLRGHGDSAWAPDADYTRSRMAADIVGLIRQLELDHLVLIGHSLGGSVAALVAAQVPDRIRALGLVDSTLLPTGRPSAMAEVVNGPEVFPSMEAFAHYAVKFNPRRRADRLVLSLRWNTRQLEDGSWTWKYDPALRRRRAPDFERVWAALEQLKCPTLFVRATERSHATDEAITKLRCLEHVTVVEVPESGHNVMGDNPLGFSREVRKFLEIQ